MSVCCSSDLCEIRDAVSEGAAAATFAHAARDDGAPLARTPGCTSGCNPCHPQPADPRISHLPGAGGLSHFLLKGGKTVQAVGGAPTATAAECEEAVRKSNLLPDT